MTSTELSPAATGGAAPTRPPGVKVLVAVGMVQGLVLLLGGSAAILGREDAQVQADLEAGPTGVAATGTVLAALGVLSVVVAIGLLQRRSGARAAYALVAVVQLAATVYAMIALNDIRGGSAWSLAVALTVLWFLYGSERSQAYFDSKR